MTRTLFLWLSYALYILILSDCGSDKVTSVPSKIVEPNAPPNFDSKGAAGANVANSGSTGSPGGAGQVGASGGVTGTGGTGSLGAMGMSGASGNIGSNPGTPPSPQVPNNPSTRNCPNSGPSGALYINGCPRTQWVRRGSNNWVIWDFYNASRCEFYGLRMSYCPTQNHFNFPNRKRDSFLSSGRSPYFYFVADYSDTYQLVCYSNDGRSEYRHIDVWVY